MSEDNGGPQPSDEPGHWERKAAEDAGQAPAPPPPPPTTEQAGGQQSVSPYPPSYPAPGAEGPYGAYAPPPGYPPQQPGYQGYPGYVLPDHPRATTALVLGIVAVAGVFTCFLPVVVAPFAWFIGAKARREIRSAPQQWGGDGRATAGMVLGIIGTVLLVLGVVVIAIFLILAISDPTVFNDNGGVNAQGRVG